MESKQEYWEGLAAGSFFLVATGAMMLVVLAILDLAGAEIAVQMNGWASLAAVAMGAIGGLMLMVEAGNKAKAYLIIANPSSAASKNAIMMTSFMGLAFVYATFFFDFIPWSSLIGLKSVIAVLGIITAIIAVIIPAFELGESRGRAFWNTSGLTPLFLITSAAAGMAAVVLAATLMGYAQNPAIHLVEQTLLGFLVLQLVSVLAYVLGMKNNGASEARKAAENILQGEFKTSFWSGIIGLGTVIPMLMFLADSTSTMLIIKTILVLIGGIFFRNIFLQAAVRKIIPGEENEWVSREEAACLAIQLEKRWQEKARALYNQP